MRKEGKINDIKNCYECPYHEEMLFNVGMDKLVRCPYINSKYQSIFKNNKIPKNCPYEILKKHDRNVKRKIYEQICEYLSNYNLSTRLYGKQKFCDLLDEICEINKEI